MRYHAAVLVAASPPLSEGNHSGCSMMLQSRRAAVEQEEGGRLGAIAIKQEGVRVGKLARCHILAIIVPAAPLAIAKPAASSPSPPSGGG
jgi:hypothetical protein